MEFDDDGCNDIYISTPSGSVSEQEDDQSEEPLQMITKPAQDGYIINNQCFLTWKQWHTILPSLSSEWVKCAVCESDFEKQLSIKHVASPEHLEQLGAAPPLAKYNRSIIRKIGHQYHCGVCNDVFFEKEELEHIDNLPHKENLLFAINKASDLRNGLPFTKKVRINQIQYPCEDDNLGISGDTCTNNDNKKKSINLQNSYDCATEQCFKGKMSYADAVKTTKSVTEYQGFTKKLGINHIQYPCEDDNLGILEDTCANNDNKNKSINLQNSYDCATEQCFKGKMSYADAVKTTKSVTKYQGFTKKVRINHIQYPCEDDNLGISEDTCANNDNKKKSINSQNSYDCATEQCFKGKMSYADAVKTTKSVNKSVTKSVTKYQGFLDIDLGSKTLKIPFDSWHMIVNLKDKFWCMVCKLFDRFKDKHCIEDLHLNKLSKCLVVEEYKDKEYFIRKVDEKFYHCGHCNNLLMIDQIQEHVIVNHSKKSYKNMNTKSDSSSKALSKVYR